MIGMHVILTSLAHFFFRSKRFRSCKQLRKSGGLHALQQPLKQHGTIIVDKRKMSSPRAKRPKLERLSSFYSEYYPRPKPDLLLVQKYLKEENKPYHILNRTLDETADARSSIRPQGCVGHLFLRDFRQSDNTGLNAASRMAAKENLPLVCLYVLCRDDLFAHGVSGFQLEYRLRSLELLREELAQKNIPLVFLNVDERKEVVPIVKEKAQQLKISHLFANIEYEVDELRRYTNLCKELLKADISFQPHNDTTLAVPGTIVTKSKGTQFSVFTPWYRAWCAHLNKMKDSFQVRAKPEANSDEFRQRNSHLFDLKIPQAPPGKQLTEKQKEAFEKYHKPGENAAWDDLQDFITSGRIKRYNVDRNDPSVNGVSRMSVHFASGTINARTVIRSLLDHKLLRTIDSGNDGAREWARQVAWRDFYRHVLCNWPHICMFKPFISNMDEVKWEYNSDHFERWCQGKTGYPIVDAAMRQLLEMGYLHNRVRMVVASFLSKHLMIDWREGERYFLENLADGDFPSNNGGWGFSSSVGVDPQPYFRIFNPWTQAEKFDKKGDYIRKWLPELREIQDVKGIHNPYENGYRQIAEKNGYPPPIVDHKTARERALERYKEAKY